MIKAGRARAPAMVTVGDPWFVKERMANGTRWPDQIESQNGQRELKEK